LKSNIIVYKGINSSTVYNDPAFISTSELYDEALNFAGDNCCIIQINVYKGSKVLDISSLSRYKEEKEFLLDRNGILNVNYTKKINGMNIIYCDYFKLSDS